MFVVDASDPVNEDVEVFEIGVMLRGITDKWHLKSYLDGSFVGFGVYGNGNYFVGARTWRTAFQYITPYGWMFAAKLDPRSNVFLYDPQSAIGLAERIRAGIAASKSMELRQFLQDEGRFLAYNGFDAIYVKDEDHVVVLNNRAVIVDDSSLPGGSIYEGVVSQPPKVTKAMKRALENAAMEARIEARKELDAGNVPAAEEAIDVLRAANLKLDELENTTIDIPLLQRRIQDRYGLK